MLAIATYLNKEIVEFIYAQGNAKLLGVVTETLKIPEVNIVQLNKNVVINTREKYHFLGDSSYVRQSIDSMQVDGVNNEEVTSSEDEFEIGIKSHTLHKKRTKIYSDQQ